MLDSGIWFCRLWILVSVVLFKRAYADGLPEPFCEHFVCDNNVLPLDTVSMKGHYNLEARGTFLPMHNRACWGTKFWTPMVSTGLPAHIGHGYCDEGGKPSIRDAIVMGIDVDDPLNLEGLLNQSTGNLALTEPQGLEDFRYQGCVDEAGYKVGEADYGRPLGCFSVIAQFENEVLTSSSRMSWNIVPFAVHSELWRFLINYHTWNASNDVRNDLICVERYEQNLGDTLADYCARLVYPRSYYHICCCYNEQDARICHIHSNPLNKPQESKNIRCLHGKFDSSQPLQIEFLNASQSAVFGNFAHYCSITYKLNLTGPKMHLEYTQEDGMDEWPVDRERGEHLEYTVGNFSCFALDPERCPKESPQKYADSYWFQCICKHDFCNIDHFSSTIVNMRPFEWIGSHVKRMEYRIEENCLEPNLPIRGFYRVSCHETECIKEDDLPKCTETRLSDAASLTDLDRFMSMSGEVVSNTTGRCYARATFTDSRRFDLDAGAVDDMALEDMRNCLKKTEIEDCDTFTEHYPKTIHWVCCYYKSPLTAKKRLRQMLQSIVMPQTVEDIQPYVGAGNLTVCIMKWREGKNPESKCLTDGESAIDEDQQRFQFCASRMNDRKCAALNRNEYSAGYCCCGSTVTGCALKLSDQGRQFKEFLTEEE